MNEEADSITDISKMNVKSLKQQLIKRGLPIDGLKAVLVERLEKAKQQQEEKKLSNVAFHSLHPRLESTRKKVTQKEEEVAEHEAGAAAARAELAKHEARLAVARTELETTKTELSHAEHEFKALEPRLSFSPKLPTSVLLSILGQLGKKAGERAACVKRDWRDVVGTAKALGMYKITVLFVAAAGGGDDSSVFCCSTGVFSCGGGVEHEEEAPRTPSPL